MKSRKQDMTFKFDRVLALKIFLVLLASLAVTMQAQISSPELVFKYDWCGQLIDVVGSLFFKNKFGFKKIESTQKEQFRKSLPRLIASWTEQGPILFGEIFSLFNCGFKQKRRTVTIFLGANLGYGSSNFLVLGLRSYLDSELWEEPISREDAFAALVFHELLHIWVDDAINGESALLTKYGNEHIHVREHIHLMAIQKMVYLKLQPDMLKFLDESYRKFASSEYRRAWEIVNDIEGYEKVLQDITDKLTCSNKS